MKRELKIVFMGTPEFAVPSLQAIHESGYQVVGVVTAPDKKAGRGQKVSSSPVKQYAEKAGLRILQPTNLKSPEFQEELRSLEADLFVIVAFRMLPEAVWSMPELGSFNLHASLLPDYRGAAPINWAIIRGEKETGITTFFLKHEIDTGDVILQEREPIHPNDTVEDLYHRLMEKGANAVLRTVGMIANDEVSTQPQREPKPGKEAPKIFKETCKIDWHQPSQAIHNFVRGLSPYPAAWTELNGKTFKIYFGEPVITADHPAPGEIDTDSKSYLRVGTADGYYSIKQLQMEGKKRMQIDELLRGYRFEG